MASFNPFGSVGRIGMYRLAVVNVCVRELCGCINIGQAYNLKTAASCPALPPLSRFHRRILNGHVSSDVAPYTFRTV